MPGVVVLGCQFGDEGKGKVIDYLAERADLVVRFHGGANAGHTVLVGDEKYAFHLVPSGILRPATMNVIGNGVVVEPPALLQELEDLRKRGHAAENLRISDRAHIVMPYHKVQDRVEEDLKGRLKAGTTGRGIGPAYEDKVGRFGIRMADLLDPSMLQDKLETVVPIKQRLLQAYGSHEVLDAKAIFREYAGYGERLARYVTDTSILVEAALRSGKRILFEGAHGTLLDVDFGVYPFGVSSNCAAAMASIGSGVGPQAIGEVIGVVKAFTSRVGTGPFPAELQDATAEHLRERGGGEYGTTTHRPRRVGWIDLVMLRLAARVNGLTGIAVTKLDVLGGLPTVKACTAYTFAEERIEEFPADLRVLSKARPVFEEFAGWPDLKEDEWGRLARKGYDALPETMRAYLDAISKAMRAPIRVVSVGQSREATIHLAT
ncbi:MAG: adenylosuccinate synthase [Methanobacteriota archaeon]|nr:MAG: adenylosuccinate synthase [Euryarchaeota archaeon]